MEAVDKSHPYWIIVELSARMSQPVESKKVANSSVWWKFAAYNFISNRIRKADRGFFENLGSLLATKVRAQNEAVNSLAEEIKEDSDSEEESGEDPYKVLLEINRDRSPTTERSHDLIVDPVDLNIDKFYASLVYLSQNQIGLDIQNGCNQACVLNHLQRVFKFDDKTHKQALDLAENLEPPKIYLKVEVIEAQELLAKDSNGKSDPFCTLYLDSEPTVKYNTTVKQETLTPIWKEHFKLPLHKPTDDVLCLEVWDFDGTETVSETISKATKVTSLQGGFKFAKELALTARRGNIDKEFIGECHIPVKDIPITGHVMWCALEKKKKSRHRGDVHLRLAFGTESDTDMACKEHRYLLRILLLEEIAAQKVEEYFWCGRWSAPAEVILLQHSVQRGLQAQDAALVQWVEYIRVHQEHALSYTLLKNLAVKLSRNMDNNLFSNDETKLFWDATKILLHSCLNSVRKIRRIKMGDRSKITQLTAILGILSTLNSLQKPDDVDLFPVKMYGWLSELREPRTDVMQVLQEAVIQGAEEWYDCILKNNTLEEGTDKNIVTYWIKVTQLINADLQGATDSYDTVFIEQVNFAYARALFIHYEKSIAEMCISIVKSVCTRLTPMQVERRDVTSEELDLSTALLELYLAIQIYANRGAELCADDFENMKIRSYYEWFREWVDHWLGIRFSKALQIIERAVELDTLQPDHPKVRYSSSAVDTLHILHYFNIFWAKLAWPDMRDSHIYISKIIDIISRCCIEYANRMARKAEDTSQQIYQMEFKVSKAWCFAMNNIDHICTSIAFLAKDLGVQSIAESLATVETQRVAETCRNTLQLLIDDTADTINNKLMRLLEIVANKMTPAITRYLIEGAESINSSSSSTDRLLLYLDANLTTLNDNLNATNFKIVLPIIRQKLLRTLLDIINDNLKRRRPPSFYANLHQSLQELIRFFNFETSDIHVLENIEQILKLHGLETAALIHRYNRERLQEQKSMKQSLHGELTVRAHFVDNFLNIEIMNARDLQPMDSNGECDPYVQILLLPEEKFAQVKRRKTRIHKATRFPLFEETFSISLSPELRDTEDAMLLFKVKDKDLLRKRFMAEAFLAFSEIRETCPLKNFDSLEQIHLKLSKPTGKDSEVIRALELRKKDDQALDFLSKLDVKINTR